MVPGNGSRPRIGAGPGQQGRDISRRGFLKAGGTALGTLTGSALLGAETAQPSGALVQIFLPGGPSHLDTFDPKPSAPAGIRGEFRAVATTVPGLQFCEHLPALASMAKHLTVVRGVTGLPDEHGAGPFDAGTTASGQTGLGAVLSRLWGSSQRTPRGEVPTAVDLSGWSSADPRRLGRPAPRVSHFNELCVSECECEPVPGPLGRALDLGLESWRALERYGADVHAENARFLRARRLVELGVRCVAFSWGYWDTHGDNFGQLRKQLPLFDRGLAALIEDLRAGGRLDEVVVVAGGEFGRTPKVNDGVGRDHWPRAGSLLVAGGGLPHGRAIGATDRLGAEPTRPVRLEEAFAPVRGRLGIAAPPEFPPA